MAKVKNPQLPVYEVLAYENPDDPYTLGDAWRGTLTEGYLLYFDDEDYTVRKSSRGERPSQKGFDLKIQMKWREAFAACVDVWRNLPNECPEAQSCHVGASKQSVWAAKQEYGVVCSYYDLFMRCCLKSFRDSVDWSFNPEDCFPCPEMLCEGVEIGYTTQQMSVGEEQELTAIGVSDGVECTWEIESGGGSLSGNTGESVVYTAPDTNAECALNPTITLSCCGTQCDSLKIAVNAAVQWQSYYRCFTPAGGYSTNQCVVYYTCTGIVAVLGQGCTRASPLPQCIPFDAGCTLITTCCKYTGGTCALGILVDLRTAAQKTAGCCPAALL